jgi:hypothetical protein
MDLKKLNRDVESRLKKKLSAGSAENTREAERSIDSVWSSLRAAVTGAEHLSYLLNDVDERELSGAAQRRLAEIRSLTQQISRVL